MREAVSAIFVAGEKIFVIQRQNYLPVFPGYHAFPGGKVDKNDFDEKLSTKYLDNFPGHLMSALCRELDEELNYNLQEEIENGNVLGVEELGLAITPEFNPYRFKTYFYKVVLKDENEFVVDQNEAANSYWVKAQELLDKYQRAEILAVPPTIALIKALGKDILCKGPIELSLPYNAETEVAMIESIYGIRQFLPLSNTFPPANRTNSFIIGDEIEHRVLVDPSPKNAEELSKFKRSLDKIGFSSIFITHHHPDHHEYAPELAKFYKVPIGLGEDTHRRILKKWGDNYFDGINIKIFNEGDILTQSLGQNVKIYAVPGHDEGQLAIAPDNLNWFLVGDLIQTVGTVVIGGDEGDMAKYFSSLQKVIDLSPKFIIPSHGIAMGGVFKLEQTLKHRMAREEQIKSLHNEGKNLNEILSIVYEGLDQRLEKYALETIKAHLNKLKLPY